MERRRFVICGVLLIASLSAPDARSQNNASAEAQLNTEYKGKLFRLRGFYSGKPVEWDESGKPLGRASVGSWTLATVGLRAGLCVLILRTAATVSSSEKHL